MRTTPAPTSHPTAARTSRPSQRRLRRELEKAVEAARRLLRPLAVQPRGSLLQGASPGDADLLGVGRPRGAERLRPLARLSARPEARRLPERRLRGAAGVSLIRGDAPRPDVSLLPLGAR